MSTGRRRTSILSVEPRRRGVPKRPRGRIAEPFEHDSRRPRRLAGQSWSPPPTRRREACPPLRTTAARRALHPHPPCPERRGNRTGPPSKSVTYCAFNSTPGVQVPAVPDRLDGLEAQPLRPAARPAPADLVSLSAETCRGARWGGSRALARGCLRGAAAGRLRPQRLRVRVLKPGGRHVAAHDEMPSRPSRLWQNRGIVRLPHRYRPLTEE